MRPDERPTLPGVVIRRDVLEPLGLRQSDLARAMGVSAVQVSYLLRGRSPVTANIAVRLAKVTSSDAAYWLKLQSDFDLFRAAKQLNTTLDELEVLRVRVRDPEALERRTETQQNS